MPDNSDLISRLLIPTDFQYDLSNDVDIPEGESAPIVSFTFNDKDVVCHFPPGQTFTFVGASFMQNVFSEVEAISRLLTVLHRWQRNHPTRWGLVPKEFPITDDSPRSTILSEASQHAHNSDGADNIIARLANEWKNDEIAWFAPGADPSAFGTYYMISVGSLVADAREFYRPTPYPDLGWALAQVGVKPASAPRYGADIAAGEFAAWNEDEKIREFAQRTLDEEVELSLTMRALTDALAAQRDLSDHRYRTSLLGAREAFAENKIRPRLVDQAVQSAIATTGLEQFRDAGYYNEGRRPYFGLQTLDDTRVFGWGSGIKGINAAYAVTFDASTPIPKLRALVVDLQQRLAARALGTVLVDAGDPTTLFVTANVDLFNAHRAAFLVKPEAQLVSGLDWINRSTQRKAS